MEISWKWLNICLGLLFFQLCNGFPINSEDFVADQHTQLLTGLVAVLLTVCSVVFLAGCLCCHRRNGFKEFRDSPVVASTASNLDHGHVNPISNGEFTIFTPLSSSPYNNNIFLANERIITRTAEDFVYEDYDVSSWFSESEKDFPRIKLKYIKELGRGWFGKVVEGAAKEVPPNELAWTPVIVRILDATASRKERILFLSDAAIYKCGAHANVLSLIGRCLDTVPLLLLQEYCPQGDLKNYLRNKKENVEQLLTTDYPLQWCCQLTSALKHLHNNGVTHPDLATRNCQLTSDFNLKLGDYGLAESKYPQDYYQGSIKIPVRWCSPESLNCTLTTIQPKKITTESNIWSLGVCLWEICECGEQPYSNLSDDEVISQVFGPQHVRLSRPKFRLLYTDYLYRLMQLCWTNAESRPTMYQIDLMLSDLWQVYKNTKTTDLSVDDFDKRWESFKPNSIVKSDVIINNMEMEESDGSITKPLSPSLNNLHGSLDNILEPNDQMELWLDNVTKGDNLSFTKSNSNVVLSLDPLVSEISSSDSGEADTSQHRKSKLKSKIDFDLNTKFRDSIFRQPYNFSDSVLFSQRTSSESETEDENWRNKVERGAYTEKVRLKSRSVADLMILTHVDYSESESETPLPSLDYRVNYKNVRYAPKNNLENVSLTYGSEGNLLSVHNTFQEELKKLKEERRDSLLFVPDNDSQNSYNLDNNDNFHAEELSNSNRFNDVSRMDTSKRLMHELNRVAELQPTNQVFNVFNVTIDKFKPVHVNNSQLNEIINLNNGDDCYNTKLKEETGMLVDDLKEESPLLVDEKQLSDSCGKHISDFNAYLSPPIVDNSNLKSRSNNIDSYHMLNENTDTIYQSCSMSHNNEKDTGFDIELNDPFKSCSDEVTDNLKNNVQDAEDHTIVETINPEFLLSNYNVENQTGLLNVIPDNNVTLNIEISDPEHLDSDNGIKINNLQTKQLPEEGLMTSLGCDINVSFKENLKSTQDFLLAEKQFETNQNRVARSNCDGETRVCNEIKEDNHVPTSLEIVESQINNSNENSVLETKTDSVSVLFEIKDLLEDPPTQPIVNSEEQELVCNLNETKVYCDNLLYETDLFMLDNASNLKNNEPQETASITEEILISDTLENELISIDKNVYPEANSNSEALKTLTNDEDRQNVKLENHVPKLIDIAKSTIEKITNVNDNVGDQEKCVSEIRKMLIKRNDESIEENLVAKQQKELEEAEVNNQVPKLIYLAQNSITVDKNETISSEMVFNSFEMPKLRDIIINKNLNDHASQFYKECTKVPKISHNFISIRNEDLVKESENIGSKYVSNLDYTVSEKLPEIDLNKKITSENDLIPENSNETINSYSSISLEDLEDNKVEQHFVVPKLSVIIKNGVPQIPKNKNIKSDNSITQEYPGIENQLENKPEVMQIDLSDEQNEVSIEQVNFGIFTSTPACKKNQNYANPEYVTTLFDTNKEKVSEEAELYTELIPLDTSKELNYSLETWDNFLRKTLDAQTVLPKENMFDSFYSEPHSLLFIEAEHNPPQSQVHREGNDNEDVVYHQDQADNVSNINNGTYVAETKNDRTYDVDHSELATRTGNRTFQLHKTDSVESDTDEANDNTAWGSGGGWFLHPQTSTKEPSGMMEVRESTDSYVGFGIDDEVMAAIRNELITKLPHAQVAPSEKVTETEEWDAADRNEVFLKYNIYNPPLSPILEESYIEESDILTPKHESDNEDSEWSEPGIPQTLPPELESQSAHTYDSQLKGPLHRHTPSQDSCCSNDTLFNLEELTCAPGDAEKDSEVPKNVLTEKDNLNINNNDEKVETDSLLNIEQKIVPDIAQQKQEDIEYENKRKNLTTVIVTESIDCNLEDGKDVEEKNWEASDQDEHIVYFTNPESTNYIADFIFQEKEHSSTQFSKLNGVSNSESNSLLDNVVFKKVQVAPLPSPEDKPWKQLPASLLSYDKVISQSNTLLLPSSECITQVPELKDLAKEYVESQSKYENEYTGCADTTEPYYENCNVDNISSFDNVKNDQPDYENVTRDELMYENTKDSQPVYENVKETQPLYQNYSISKDIYNEADYVNIVNLENSKNNGEYDKKDESIDFEHDEQKIINETSQDGDTLYGMLTDIKFNGPAENQLISTSFSESNDINDEQDWDSGSDTRSSSSGEFIWKEGEHEESLKALRAAPQDVLEDVKPMEEIAEESTDENDVSSGSSDEEGEVPEFVPSAWDKFATPTKSALRSPEKTLEKSEKNKSKGVWFKKQKYHCVYEYPREPESPILQSQDLWKPQVDFSSLTDWEFDADTYFPPSTEDNDFLPSACNYQPKSNSSKNLYQLTNIPGFASSNNSLDDEFFVSSSARPFDVGGSLSSQFFPGSTNWIGENATPDSGMEDGTPGSSTEIECADINKTSNNMVHTLKKLASDAVNRNKQMNIRTNDVLGGLRHTRNKLKLDLPPSPNAYTCTKMFTVEPNLEPVIREKPTFTTFGKSRFSVQHVDTPPEESKNKNVSFEALPYKPPKEETRIDALKDSCQDLSQSKLSKEFYCNEGKHEYTKGEASLLDSADEDSGIESSTLERKLSNDGILQ